MASFISLSQRKKTSILGIFHHDDNLDVDGSGQSWFHGPISNTKVVVIILCLTFLGLCYLEMRKSSTIINRWLLLPKENEQNLNKALLNFPISVMCNTRLCHSPTSTYSFLHDVLYFISTASTYTKNDEIRNNFRSISSCCCCRMPNNNNNSSSARSRNKLSPWS